MIVRIPVLYLIITIKSEVWSVCFCLGLGHKIMVCTVSYYVLMCVLFKIFRFSPIHQRKCGLLMNNGIIHYTNQIIKDTCKLMRATSNIWKLKLILTLYIVLFLDEIGRDIMTSSYHKILGFRGVSEIQTTWSSDQYFGFSVVKTHEIHRQITMPHVNNL